MFSGHCFDSEEEDAKMAADKKINNKPKIAVLVGHVGPVASTDGLTILCLLERCCITLYLGIKFCSV